VPRKPKPYVKDGYYRTSFAGVKHRILCPVEDGVRQAEVALAKLIVQLDDIRRNGGVPTNLEAGPMREAAPTAVPKVTYPTLAEALDDFMTFVKSESSAGTYRWYQEKLWPLRERFADWTVNKLTYQEGLKFKTWLRQEKTWRKGKNGPPQKGLANTTVNHHLRAARTFLEWCCKPSRRHTYGFAVNPWEEIGYMDVKPRERVITDDEFGHLLANCEDGNTRGAAEEMRNQLVVLRHTTMRPQELRELKWDYVKWAEHRVVFPATVIKTRKRREVSLIDVVEQALEKWKRRLETFGLRPHGRYVFPSHGYPEGVRVAGLGERKQSAGKVSQRFRRLVERCVAKGLIEKEKAGERLVPYSTRHTRITELFTEGVPQAVVMFEAGHTNPLTTERYKHMASSHVTETIRKSSQAKQARASTAGSAGSAGPASGSASTS
jgi:site-specific recombinase XerD